MFCFQFNPHFLLRKSSWVWGLGLFLGFVGNVLLSPGETYPILRIQGIVDNSQLLLWDSGITSWHRKVEEESPPPAQNPFVGKGILGQVWGFLGAAGIPRSLLEKTDEGFRKRCGCLQKDLQVIGIS